MKKKLFPALLCYSLMSLSLTQHAFGQLKNEIVIVPQPVEIQLQSTSKFIINKNTALVLQGSGLERSATSFNNYLQLLYGFKLKISKQRVGKNEILLNYERLDHPIPGAYILEVNENNIYIAGDNESGVFYGIQTLLQLLPTPNHKLQTTNYKLPLLTIKDHPRFPYRGMHLDVARHFFQPSFIKKYIDYLAYHKFNTFHWHLTEDQGWRIEIKKYPKLTSVGGFRNGTIIGRNPGTGNDGLRYGGFYTQAEIKDIVKYAADRYITIIPEIEMPGHSSAAIAAYPQLSCFPGEPTVPAKGTAWAGPRTGKQVQQGWGVFEDVFCPTEYTFNFLEDVLDEVMQLFPSKYIHIGGDECPKSSWKRSDFCQQLIKEKKLKDEHELQSYFIQRIEKYLNSKGRQIIGWDEILEGGLAPNATVMSWRGEKGGIEAAKQGHNVVMTPEAFMYFNFSQSTHEDSLTFGQYIPIEKVYGYEPVPKELINEGEKYILGAQGNVWSEYISNHKRAEYMIFPRMSALSEVLWSPKEKRSWNDFEMKLPYLYKQYEAWGAQYSNAFYELRPSILPSTNYAGVLWNLETNSKDGNIIYVKGRTQSATHNYTAPVLITAGGEYGAATTRKDHTFITSWLWQKFSFNKATGKKITLTNPPVGNWMGSGPFTLVNSIITEYKLSQSREWLGFLGKDLEAVIDLGNNEKINIIRINVLKQENSWIYLPASVEFFISDDGVNFTSVGKLNRDENGAWKDERKMEVKLSNSSARYVKVLAKNYGTIPPGMPGAGTAAWLFADEIEVE